MKRISIVFLFVLVSITSNAQYNLVPNPSFEVFDTCPNNFGQLYHSLFWINPISNSTPDYLNSCGTLNVGVPNNYYGFENAHSGAAYSAIVTGADAPNPLFDDYREYTEIQLTDSLIAGVDYCIRFYVSACDSARYVSNNIGVYFSQMQIATSCSPCYLPFTPQFENPMTNNLNNKVGWTEISGSYTASGGEKYIVIGNFNDKLNTILNYTGWSQDPSNYYYALYFLDDVLITPCDSLTGIREEEANLNINIYPNPVHDLLTVSLNKQWLVGTPTMERITINDMQGRVVGEKKTNHTPGSNGSVISIDVSSLSQGVYLLRVDGVVRRFVKL